MNLLFENIKKKVNLLNDGDIDFSIIGGPKTYSLNPFFNFDQNNTIISSQHDLFGLYVLKVAFRGIFLSANFFSSGQLNRKNSLYSPAIASYYSTCFHLLHSYLALNGRVIIDPVLTLNSEIDYLGIKSLTASFSNKNNKWTFHSNKRNHKGKWNELKQIFKHNDDVPIFFKTLFNEWYGHLIKENIPQIQRIIAQIDGENKGTPYQILDKIDEFLSRISEFRHISIYQSFASDSEVVANLINRDSYSSIGIDRQVACFQKFTIDFYLECIQLMKYLMNNIRFHYKTREYLWTTIFNPWFDNPNFELIEPYIIRDNLKKMYDWFFVKRQYKIK